MYLLTSIVILIIIGFFLVALILSLKAYFSNKCYIRTISHAIDPFSMEDLITNRRQIKETLRSSGKNDYSYKLWNEFDESLVETFDGKFLKNTLDAEHFFNPHNLGRGLINNHFLSAVPGMLTAIGVLGTFLGLALGLRGLQIGSDDIQILKSGISQMIDGAAVAFYTSIAGIGISLLFNFYEKIVESRLNKKIRALQDQINHKFPRLTAELSLHEITVTTSHSNNALQTLAEKIGDKMQEAINTLSEEMVKQLENSLSNILTPAVNELAKTSKETAAGQADGAAEALSKVIESFMEEFGSMGSTQSAEMERINKMLVSNLERLNSGIQEMLGKIDDQIRVTLGEIGEQTRDAQHNARRDIEHIGQSLGGLTTQLQQLIEQNFDGAHKVIDKTDLISGKFDSAQQILQKLAAELESMSHALNDATKNLDSSSNNIREAGSELSEGLHNAAKQNQEAASLYSEGQMQLQNTLDVIDQLSGSLHESGKTIHEGSRFARETFNDLKDHQEGYRSSLKNHVSELSTEFNELSEQLSNHISLQINSLSEKMAELLQNYARQTNADIFERMTVWNEQTREFSNAMVGVIEGMSSLVGEFNDSFEQQRRVN